MTPFIRRKAFWLADIFKRGIVQKDIEKIQSSFNGKSGLAEANLDQVNRLLWHAGSTTKFYRPFFNKELQQFPIIDKNSIRTNLGDFVSDAFKMSELKKAVTSGSTGTPFVVYHDRRKISRNTADTIFFGELANYRVGEKLYYFKIWNEINRKNALMSFIQNIKPVDVSSLSDDVLGKLIAQLRSDKSKKSFLGYASAFEAICKFIQRQYPDEMIPNVDCVIAMSEGLSDVVKSNMKQIFGVHAVSRYSNVENGIIAQQLPNGSSEFYINWASYHVELLEFESDKPVGLNSPGRIVVTDLYNFGMPMIRYDTGDVGVFNIDKLSDRVLLSKVEGRKMDMVYDVYGNLVSSFTITNNMWLFQDIIQYQFIQKSLGSYHFKLNVDRHTFKSEAHLISLFKKIFGPASTITVEYVHEIPLLNSGKRKKVVNEMKDV